MKISMEEKNNIIQFENLKNKINELKIEKYSHDKL